MEQPTHNNRWKAVRAIILALALVTAALLRWQAAQTRALHDDEMWSLMLSTGRGSVHINLPAAVLLDSVPETTSLANAPGWSHVPWAMKDATHPPGYFTTLGLWRTLLGESDLTARALSITACLIFLLLTYLAVSKLVSLEAALWIVCVLAIARPFVELTCEIRPYAFELMCWSLCAYALAKLLVHPDKPSCSAPYLLGIGTFALLMSHYFAAGVAFALLIAVATLAREKIRRHGLIAITSAGLAFAALWSPGFLQQLHAGRFSLQDEHTEFLTHTNGGPLTSILQDLSSTGRLLHTSELAPLSWWPLGLAILLLTAILLWAQRHNPQKTRGPTALLLLALGGVLAPTALDIFRHSNHTAFDRYLVAALPATLALAASATLLPARFAAARIGVRLLPALTLLIAAHSQLPRYNSEYTRYELPARLIDTINPPPDVLIFAADTEQPTIPRVQFLAFSHFAKQHNLRTLLVYDKIDDQTLAKLKTSRCAVIAYPDTRAIPTLLPIHTLRAHTQFGPLNAIWLFDPAK